MIHMTNITLDFDGNYLIIRYEEDYEYLELTELNEPSLPYIYNEGDWED